MPQLMLYLAVTAALASAAALVVEQACVSLERPRRFVWLAALLVSLALPAGAMLAARGAPAPAHASASPSAPAPVTASEPLAIDPPAVAGTTERLLPLADFSRLPVLERWSATDATRRARVDEVLIVLWIASSAGVVALYGLGLVTLHRAARRWPRQRLGRHDVLVSERLGPAIFGLLRPRIVVPRWLLRAATEQQALVIEHERQHAAARDPLLLAAALLLVALAPWNLVLWWQWSRLRAAIELDCDARVVRGGASAIAYSETLLAIRQRRTAAPLPAVALTEPVSRLETRIRTLLAAPSRLRRIATLASTPLAVVALLLACGLTPPALFAQNAGTPTRDPLTGMIIGGERVVILVDTSASMLDNTPADVLMRRDMPPEAQRAAPKWQQVVRTVEQLATQLAPGTQVQIIGFAEQAASLIEGSDGRWVTVTNGRELDSAVQALRNTVPSGASSLAAGLNALRTLDPQADNVYLLVDGLPNMGEVRPSREDVASSERVDHFYRAIRGAPAAPINVILFPMQGDDWAAPLYWELALRSGGSLIGAPIASDASAPTPLEVPDDEYVIFVVDTSGSLQSNALGRLREQIEATLAAYPSLKGLQIMNDEGSYLFKSYRGQWMPHTAAMQQAVLDGLGNWDDFADANPREGILAAIDTFADPDKRIALYVYSDDFPRGSIAEIVREIGERNSADARGNARVRINAVAFPVTWQVSGQLHTSAGLTALMRELAAGNGGRFVALPVPPRAATAAAQAAR